MTAVAIRNPYPILLDLDGEGLNNGSVYIGTPSQDPVTNPRAVYWDAGLTIPASQPLAVTGGYIANSGTPAVAYTSGAYSMKVTDRTGQQVFYASNNAGAGSKASGLVNVPNVTATNVTSQSLGPGTYLVSGTVAFGPTTLATLTDLAVGISLVSATLPGVGDGGYFNAALSYNAAVVHSIPCGSTVITLAATATVYLVCQASFTGTSISASGTLSFVPLG